MATNHPPQPSEIVMAVAALYEPELLAVRDRHMAALDAVCAGTARVAPPSLAGDGEPLRAYRAWKKNGGQP